MPNVQHIVGHKSSIRARVPKELITPSEAPLRLSSAAAGNLLYHVHDIQVSPL